MHKSVLPNMCHLVEVYRFVCQHVVYEHRDLCIDVYIFVSMLIPESVGH